MTSIPRLRIDESSLHLIRAVMRPFPSIRAANHHYWAARSGKPYGRSTIYSKDIYYTRSLAQRRSRYVRPCGSWTRGNRTNSERRKADEGPVKESPKIDPAPKHTAGGSHPFQSDHFLKLLREDASAAYKYMHEELQKDPYRWIFDQKETPSAWNAVDWWNRRKRMFDRERAWLERSFAGVQNETETEDLGTKRNIEEDEQYRIDPITMKKVPITKVSTSEVAKDDLYPRYQSKTTDIEHDIPVKKYEDGSISKLKSSRVSESVISSNDTKTSDSAQHSWLVKEGFAAVLADNAKIETMKESQINTKPSTHSTFEVKTKPKDSLPYPPKEVTTDDVDLLRASDIRAASGRVKMRSGPSQDEIKERSQALENDWKDMETSWAEDNTKAHSDILAGRKGHEPSTAPAHDASLERTAIFKHLKQLHDTLRLKIEETTSLLEKARIDALQDVLSQETNFVKQNYDNFEERSRKHAAVSNTIDQTIQPNQEYLLGQQKKLDRLERDAELAKQIRLIYEEKYGKITADHRQNTNKEETLEQRQHETPSDNAASATISSQRHSSSTEERYHSKTANTLKAGDDLKGITIRDLLYKGIECFELSSRDRKRFKFALRGMHNIDNVIPGLSEGELVAFKRSKHSTSVPEPIPMKIVETDKQTKPAKTSSGKNQPLPASKDDKVSKSQPSSTKSEQTPTKKPEESTSNRQQGSDHTASKKPEEKTYVYKILALDSATNEVVVATANSGFRHKSSVPRSSASILVHLDQPARYFPHIEKLDYEGWRIVSGSRSMLVYRKEVQPDGSSSDPVPIAGKTAKASHAMTPLRQEAVFSGHLRPKERLLRSYQLAHRRARSNAHEKITAKDTTTADHKEHAKSNTNQDQDTKPRRFRNLPSQLGTAAFVFALCYMIGYERNTKALKEHEAAAAAQRYQQALETEALKHKRNWF